MKKLFKTVLVMVLLLGAPCGLNAAVYPFLRTNWDIAPNQVITQIGMPAFHKVDFDGVRVTDYLAYHQTFSGHAFTAYYNFNDEKLYQVRLIPINALNAHQMHSLAQTMHEMLHKGLTSPRFNYTGSAPLEEDPGDGPFGAIMWWLTSGTFAVITISSDHNIFEVTLVDATNPANETFIENNLILSDIYKADDDFAENEEPVDEPVPAAPQNQPEKVAAAVNPAGFMVPQPPPQQSLWLRLFGNWLQLSIMALVLVIAVILRIQLKKRNLQDFTQQKLLRRLGLKTGGKGVLGKFRADARGGAKKP